PSRLHCLLRCSALLVFHPLLMLFSGFSHRHFAIIALFCIFTPCYGSLCLWGALATELVANYFYHLFLLQ
ncbi:MAG: hypothetical protein PUD41_05030, partial [bacterium]|nr:hypothetical protein [bacterium]